MKIVLVAFSDIEENSIVYKKTSSISDAVKHFETMLKRSDVVTISTRKIVKEDNLNKWLTEDNEKKKEAENG